MSIRCHSGGKNWAWDLKKINLCLSSGFPCQWPCEPEEVVGYTEIQFTHLRTRVSNFYHSGMLEGEHEGKTGKTPAIAWQTQLHGRPNLDYKGLSLSQALGLRVLQIAQMLPCITGLPSPLPLTSGCMASSGQLDCKPRGCM